MGNGIQAIVSKVLEEYESIVIEASREAAHKGQKNAMEKAKKCLQEYYNAYSPEMYQRKHALQRAISPYWSDSYGGGTASITIGVRYNAGMLAGAYKSNSAYHQTGNTWKVVSEEVKRDSKLFSSDYGKPEPDWILGNYLEGEHGGVYNDGQGTEEKMKKYFETVLPKRIVSYFEEAVLNAAISKI